MSQDAAERARRYLVEGDPAMALGAAEAALRDAGREDALSLRLAAARAAAALGDLAAQARHLEAAEALVRAGRLDALGPVLAQLGELHLRRNDPARAAVTLEEALGQLPADDPQAGRVRGLLDEARGREREAPQEDDPPAPPPAPPTTEAAARLLEMTERLVEQQADLELPALLDLVLAELVKAAVADRGFVLLREPGEGLVIRAARDAAGRPVPDPAREVSRKIAERAAAEQVALRAVRPAEDPRFAGSRSAKALDLRALVAAPLRYRRIDLGCVVLDRRGSRDVAFDDAAEALVDRFARLASGLIVRARLREAERRRAEALQALFARGAEQVRERFRSGGLRGESQAMFGLLRLLERVAPTEARVLIRGESGTGKELVARTIHENSPRREAPFHAVNCAAMPEALLEGELFGHVRGAFTGAEGDRAGLFERAHEGTLFLDEIGDASPRLQAELLRVLQEGEVRRLGDGSVRKVDVRVLAATHQDLEAMVAEGRFREDLLYRLNVVVVRVPPLRERPEDVPLLARQFEREARELMGDPSRATPLDDAKLSALAARPWPGNVRELKNVVTRLVTLGELAASSAAGQDAAPAAPLRAPLGVPEAARPGDDEVLTLAEAERRAIVAALRRTGGARQEAADLLECARRTLYTKIRQYGLE
ncbi:MAG: sigma-54-dependent Fis family transcriptional regulator [Planctomycetes bacterium]|nr:sigma-54-dependent Fis family transcriptional regulator [Planctomycetota bacterium]